MSAESFTLSSGPPPPKRQLLIPESVVLLIEHRSPIGTGWSFVAFEPRWFLLCTTVRRNAGTPREPVPYRS